MTHRDLQTLSGAPASCLLDAPPIVTIMGHLEEVRRELIAAREVARSSNEGEIIGEIDAQREVLSEREAEG